MTGALTIDRARFLLLATALAGATACVVEDKDEDATGGTAGVTNSGGDSNAGGQNAGGTAQGGGAGGAAGSATQNGGAAGALVGAAGGDNWGGAAGSAGESCDDTIGAPNCEGVSTACLPYCNAAVKNLKASVALAAIGCLEGVVGDWCTDGYECLAEATAGACPTDVSALCDAADNYCGATTEGVAGCVQLASGFNETGLAAYKDCLESPSCEGTDGVYSCAEGLFFENIQ
jgi:hypothetical protein